MAEAHRPAQHRGAGELHLAGLEQDRLVERQPPGLGVFADEDAKQNGVARNLHDHTHRMVLRPTAAIWPSQTASRHSTTEPPILKDACNHSPSFMRLSVWMLNEENVV